LPEKQAADVKAAGAKKFTSIDDSGPLPQSTRCGAAASWPVAIYTGAQLC